MNSGEALTKKERRALRREEIKKGRTAQDSAIVYKKIGLWAGVFALFIFGIWGFVSIIPALDGKGQAAAVIVSVNDGDWVKGEKEAAVTIVEYSDFQCPACAYYVPVVKQIASDFPNDVRIIYRHFPLAQHENARAAAYASEAAGLQGRFWEMHDLIFERQNKWAKSDRAPDIFIEMAQELGLDLERFKTDIGSAAVMDKVEGDYKSGLGARVDSTPSFFINGQKIKNLRSADEFKKIVSDMVSIKNN